MKKCKRFPVPRAYFISTVRERMSAEPEMEFGPAPAPASAQIEDHLDHVFSPLVGTVPYARRCQLRAQLRDRLNALTAEYIAAGRTPEQAVKKAIEGADSAAAAPGQARSIGNWWSRVFLGDESVPIPSARGAFYTALAWFGAAVLLTALDSPYRYPNLNIWSILIYPLVAGVAVGLRSKDKPVLGALYALLALAPVSLIASAMLGLPPAIIPALAVIVWLPIGCFAAWRAAKLRPAILNALRRHAGQAMPS